MSIEVIGGIAAVLGIADIAARLAKTTAETYRGFHDAPEEFRRHRSRLRVLEDLMLQLSALRSDDNISREESISLRGAMLEVESCLNAIQAEGRRLSPTSSKTRSMKWVLFDRDAVAKLEKRLESSQQQLVAIIVMKSFPLQHALNSKLVLILQRIEEIEIGQPVSHKQQPISVAPGNQYPTFTAPLPRRKSQPSQTSIDQLPGWLTFLGFHSTVLQIQRAHAKTIKLSARLHLPGRRGRERAAFLVDLTFHLASRFFFAYPSFGMCTVVPSDSPVVTACQRGDLRKVRRLFAERAASPRDVTSDNLTLLRHAVNHGSTELVEFLLEQGADVNSPYGKNQTSPLQWALYQRNLDIARLLGAYDAQGDHVSLGWTPIFYLFSSQPEQQLNGNSINKLDFLSVLSDNRVFLDLEVSEPGGRTVLQTVAAEGTGHEVSGLLSLGALASRTGASPWKDEWSLMHAAISAGNTSTFEALLRHDCFSNIEDLDYFGWSMLHHAAHLGHDSIVRCLLERGAEEFVPEYDSGPEDEDGDADVHGVDDEEDGDPMSEYFSKCKWTREKYFAYMQALLDHRRVEIHSALEDGVPVDEIYWDANEWPGKFDSP